MLLSRPTHIEKCQLHGTKHPCQLKHAQIRSTSKKSAQLQTYHTQSVPHEKHQRLSRRCFAKRTDNATTSTDNLSGVWIRDSEASEMKAYDEMLSMMRLSGLQRTTALRLIEGVELKQTAAELSVSFLTVVPFFKVTETFKFDGESTMGRRDLRPGTQTARMARLPKGGAYVEMSWPDPVAGRLSETYFADGKVLTVISEVLIGDQKTATKVVYRRQDSWTPKYQFTPGQFKLGPFSF